MYASEEICNLKKKIILLPHSKPTRYPSTIDYPFALNPLHMFVLFLFLFSP